MSGTDKDAAYISDGIFRFRRYRTEYKLDDGRTVHGPVAVVSIVEEDGEISRDVFERIVVDE